MLSDTSQILQLYVTDTSRHVNTKTGHYIFLNTICDRDEPKAIDILLTMIPNSYPSNINHIFTLSYNSLYHYQYQARFNRYQC